MDQRLNSTAESKLFLAEELLSVSLLFDLFNEYFMRLFEKSIIHHEVH